MPFRSEKQRRFMHAQHPDIAERWEHEYGGTVKNYDDGNTSHSPGQSSYSHDPNSVRPRDFPEGSPEFTVLSQQHGRIVMADDPKTRQNCDYPIR
jgi:hypothetical protein